MIDNNWRIEPDRKERCKSALIQSDSWIKKIKEAKTAEELACQFEKRFENSYLVGPTLIWNYLHKEPPADIIIDLIDTDQLDIDDVEKACQFILEKAIQEEPISPTHSKAVSEQSKVIAGVCYLIHELNLDSCTKQLTKWLNNNHEKYNDRKHIKDWEQCYVSALIAIAYIQPKNSQWNKFWIDIWDTSQSELWYAAMLGLILQSPIKALDYMPEIIDRKINDYPHLLHKLWFNEVAKVTMEEMMFNGLADHQVWAGLAINALAKELNVPGKETLIRNLSNIRKSLQIEKLASNIIDG